VNTGVLFLWVKRTWKRSVQEVRVFVTRFNCGMYFRVRAIFVSDCKPFKI